MKALVPFTIITLLLAGGSAICVSAQTDIQRSVEQEIRCLSDEEVQAFLHNDPKAMARLWSDDLVVTNPLNKFVNKQDVLGMMQSGFLVITSSDRRIEYARVYGNIVILAGSETVVWGGKMPIAGKTQELRFTAIWMKQGARWQEVEPATPISCLTSQRSQTERDPNSGAIPSAAGRQH